VFIDLITTVQVQGLENKMASKHFDRPENAQKLDFRGQGLLLWVQDSGCMIVNKPVDRKASRRLPLANILGFRAQSL
jgi:hypothetical protein